MTVQEILKAKNREVITATREMSVKEAMNLLISNKVSCLPVLSADNQLEGILSDKDIFHHAHREPGRFTEATVGELMTEDVLVGIPGDEVSYIAAVMTNNRIRHIPIVDAKQLVGLVSVGDVVKTQMELVVAENRHLKQYIAGDYPA